MEKLKRTYCKYNMVCDDTQKANVEIISMPEYFSQKPELETHELHVHPYYEVIWFKEAEGLHYVDFNEYKVYPNTVFFIAPGQVHSFDKFTSSKGYVIKISSELLDSEMLSQDGVLLKYNVFNAYDAAPCININEDVCNATTRILQAIEREVPNIYEIGHMEYLRTLVKLLIIQFERSFNNAENVHLYTPCRTSHKAFLSFRRELEHNFKTKHSVKEYAMMLNITTKTLSNYVSECSSFTPLEIINNRIVLEAKRLLRYSDYMVKEIAFNLGFEDPSYFIKYFKREVGCSPSDYRSAE